MNRAAPLAGLVCCLLAAGIAWGQDAPARGDAEPRAERARRLVEQLGADDFFSREQAARELAELGRFALEALQAGAKSGDREVRYSSLRLLSSMREADLQRRLTAFAAGRDDELDEPLPMWDVYRGIVGDSAEARRLFVDMQTHEPELLSLLAENPRRAGEFLADRVQQIPLEMRVNPTQVQEIPLGTVAALLLAAGDGGVGVPARGSGPIYSFCYQRGVQSALAGGAHEAEVRKLLGRWIARGEDSLVYPGMVLATQHELKEGLIPARRILRQGGHQPYLVQHAVATIARLGDAGDVPLLEPLLADATHLTHRNVGEANRPVDVQVRDVALAAVVHLSGREFGEFGLKHIQPNPQTVFTPNSACFETDAERTAALQKWRELRESGAPARPADGSQP
jgi:hypothetical protein